MLEGTKLFSPAVLLFGIYTEEKLRKLPELTRTNISAAKISVIYQIAIALSLQTNQHEKRIFNGDLIYPFVFCSFSECLFTKKKCKGKNS